MDWFNIGACQYKLESNKLWLKNKFFTYAVSDVPQVTAMVGDRGGRMKPYMELSAENRTYRVWEDLPMVWLSNPPKMLLKLRGEHWTIRAVKLIAYTDFNDTLTDDRTVQLFRGKTLPLKGDLFFLENRARGECIVVVSETPDYIVSTLRIEDFELRLENSGNSLAIGFCRAGEGTGLLRDYGRHVSRPRLPLAMANTWGDGNGARRVCHDFIVKEIDAAAELGLDAVQIDDGWQKGRTNDPAIFDEERYRRFDGDFWELDRERFPQGMEAIAAYAAKKGVKLGLWFAPDPHESDAHLERDIAVLKKAYEEWQIRYFKLDMFYVRTPEEQKQITALLAAIHGFGGDVAVQMDVTRPLRLNYLCAAEYGSVFVENRYTKTHTFFPHRTLRNLWSLAKYLPAGRLQFELVNPDLYREQYDEKDVLAPATYPMDYQFAAVMLSNPLFWMETQFLSKERREELQRILPVWKEHRAVLRGAEIVPVGDCPNGKSITGFLVRKDRKNRYLLVFREATEAAAAMIPMQVIPKELRLLASSCAAKAELLPGAAKVSFVQPRSYAFYEIEE